MRPGARPSPGVPEDSDLVHDEIKQLASETKEVLKKNFSRHATNEQQVLAGLQQFGPSAQSKAMLNREESAAAAALETGVYVVYRNENSKTATDFCTRVGPQHKCRCSHTLAEHGAPKKSRRGLDAPSCTSCDCRAFQYVPNEPEEVGDHHISRRAGFVPGTWSPNCQCGHRAFEHDGESSKCRKCACFRFGGKFGCIVCDGFGQDHVTVFETASERSAVGRPVMEAYFPLSGAGHAEFRQLVFDKPRGPQRSSPPPSAANVGSHRPAPKPAQSDLSFVSSEPPGSCTNCGTAFRSRSSNFCSHCGARANK